MTATQLAMTGIPGLDNVLSGGLPRDHLYLVQGDPGVGKTTVGLQFLMAGAANGEPCLYITLSESQLELQAVAQSHHWNLSGVDIVEVSAIEQSSGLESPNTLFEPSEVELQETTRTLLDHIERVRPTRVVIDSLSELRLLAQNALRFRRQVLGLKQYFADKHSTVLLLDDRTTEPNDLQLQSLAHGVIHLEQIAPLYGEDRRRLRVRKLRGVRFRGGYHDYSIRTGGLEVFPRLVAAEHHTRFVAEQLSANITELDALLGGGVDRGTCTLLTGPAGTGKSAIAVQYAAASAIRGERAAIFAFDERITTLVHRSRALGVDVEGLTAANRLSVQQVDPAEMSVGELTHVIRNMVENDGVKLIVVDSLNGYLQAMPEDTALTVQLHELLSYLAQQGVTTLLTMAQHGLFGTMAAPVDVSYLADTVLLLRYFEAEGRIRKAISVVKKRSGAHENLIRELSIGGGKITVGRPLDGFSGVLTGVPSFTGKVSDLAKP
ncbi:MAG: ATPase domain-containing protein [Kofleriaceae bacterium]